MRSFLGIDGGGTKTKVVVINDHGDILYENTAGPSSIDTVNQETTLKHIQEALHGFSASSENLRFDAVFAGLGGIVTETDQWSVEEILRQLPSIDESTYVIVKNDMYNALFSSECYDNAMTLICGTGMVAFGKKGKQIHKAGGWGFEEGELGSAYHLGREAIRHCIRALDQRHPYDDFAKAVAQETGLHGVSDIIKTTTRYFGQRTATAALAPLVTRFANLGNAYAKRICDLATDELALAIKTVYQELGFNDVTLVMIGSLGNADGYFKEQLHQKIKHINQKINIIAPLIDPALAAARAAKHFSEEKE